MDHLKKNRPTSYQAAHKYRINPQRLTKVGEVELVTHENVSNDDIKIPAQVLYDSNYSALQKSLEYRPCLLKFCVRETEKEFLKMFYTETMRQRQLVYFVLLLLEILAGITDTRDDRWPTKPPMVMYYLLPAPPLIALVVSFIGRSEVRRPYCHLLGMTALSAAMLIFQFVLYYKIQTTTYHYTAIQVFTLIAITVGIHLPFILTVIVSTSCLVTEMALQFSVTSGSTLAPSTSIHHLSLIVFFTCCLSFMLNSTQMRLFIHKKEGEYEHKRMQELRAEQNRVEVAHAETTAHVKFLTIVSHELRTPLNAVIGASSLLHSSSNLPEEEEALTDIVMSGATSTLDLVNNVLDFSKLKAGEIVLYTQEILIPTFMHEVFTMLKPIADAKGVVLVVDIDPTLQDMGCTMDVGRVQQILHIFGSNAIKVTPKFGTITVGIHSAGSSLKFSVSDSGPGIPQEMCDNIFQPFVQVEAESYGAGTALGLSITKQLAEVMKGSVDIESEMNVGTVFSFTADFPITKMTPPSSPTCMTTSTPGKDFKKVLVCEDEPLNQRIISRMLEKCGYDYDLASNGEEGLEMYEMYHPDYFLVFMDCQMPTMDGYEATKQIREYEEGHALQRVPIVALTAEALPKDLLKCLESGMDGRLTKPVTIQVLGSELEKRSQIYITQFDFVNDDVRV